MPISTKEIAVTQWVVRSMTLKRWMGSPLKPSSTRTRPRTSRKTREREHDAEYQPAAAVAHLIVVDAAPEAALRLLEAGRVRDRAGRRCPSHRRDPAAGRRPACQPAICRPADRAGGVGLSVSSGSRRRLLRKCARAGLRAELHQLRARGKDLCRVRGLGWATARRRVCCPGLAWWSPGPLGDRSRFASEP